MLAAGHCVIKDGIRVTADRITVVAGINNHKDVWQIGRQTLPVSKDNIEPQTNIKDNF